MSRPISRPGAAASAAAGYPAQHHGNWGPGFAAPPLASAAAAAPAAFGLGGAAGVPPPYQEAPLPPARAAAFPPLAAFGAAGPGAQPTLSSSPLAAAGSWGPGTPPAPPSPWAGDAARAPAQATYSAAAAVFPAAAEGRQGSAPLGAAAGASGAQAAAGEAGSSWGRGDGVAAAPVPPREQQQWIFSQEEQDEIVRRAVSVALRATVQLGLGDGARH